MGLPKEQFFCTRNPVVPVQYNDQGVPLNSTDAPENTTHLGNTTELDSFKELANIINGILSCPILASICIFGIFGNVVNLVVLCRKAMMKGMERMEKSAHMGLIALAITDMCFCVSALPSCFIPHRFLNNNSFKNLYNIFHEGMINIFILASTWLTVTMAVSRYLAICYPLKARLLIGKSFAKGTIVVVFLLSIIFNIPRFLEKTPRSIICIEGGRMYYWVPGPLSPYVRPKFRPAYQWLYFLLGILSPLLVMLFCNVRLIKALRKSRKMKTVGFKHGNGSRKYSSQSRRVTLILVIIVIMYLVLVSPAEINTFLKEVALKDTNTVTWYNIAISLLNTLQSINFAFNFVLYCAVNTYFRRTIKGMICHWTRVERHPIKSFRSMNSSTKTHLSARNSHTYFSEISTVM